MANSGAAVAHAMYEIPTSNISEFEVTHEYALEKLHAANFDTSIIK